ncbi:hypothetical protein JCM6882_007295 [Rhodosporidiobolus microsporus]
MPALLPEGRRTALVLLRSPTKAPDQDPYRSAAVDAGFSSVHLLPVLSTSFTNLSRLAEVLSSGADGCDGVVMTSARSAEAWAAAAATLDPFSSPSSVNPSANPPSSPTPPFFVVGTGTRSALLERLPEARRPPEEAILGAEETGTGESLARFILEHFGAEDDNVAAGEGRRRRKLLYLTGDKNRDTLPAILGASSSPSVDLDPLQVYATSTCPSFSSALPALLDELSSVASSSFAPSSPPPQTVWFALFSPSSALPLINHLRALSLLPYAPSSSAQTSSASSSSPSLHLRFVAIGPTTRDYLEQELGVEVHATATKPEATALVEAVVEAVRNEDEGRTELAVNGKKGEKEKRL